MVSFETMEGVPQGEVQQRLHIEVAQHFGEPQDAIAGWVINRVRDDGAVDAYVPIPSINAEGVPVDDKNVGQLVVKFDNRAREVGGSGQRDPCVVGHVPLDSFYLLDGYHRREVQVLREVSHLHCTVEPRLTFDQVVQRRIEYAENHEGIKFARRGEWMEEDWERTSFYDELPEGMTVLAAFRLYEEGVAMQQNTGERIIHRLSEELSEKVCAFVEDRSKRWGYTPAELREKTAESEGLARDLLPLVWQKQGRTPAGRISLAHVAAINDTYAGEFDMQEPLVELIVAHELSAPQTAELIRTIEDEAPVTADDLLAVAADVDILELKRQRSPRKGSKIVTRSKSHEAKETRTAAQVMSEVRASLPAIQDEARSGRWGRQEMDDLLEVTAGLTELLAQLALDSASNQG